MHTDELIEAYARRSDDPVKQVVCILYDLDDHGLIAWGTNQIITTFKEKAPVWCDEVVSTPLHPAKKLIMQHAEISALAELKRIRRLINRNHIGAYVSLQPCLDCVRAIVPYVSEIRWKEDNRHQDEQSLISLVSRKVFTKYEKQENGLTLTLPI